MEILSRLEVKSNRLQPNVCLNQLEGNVKGSAETRTLSALQLQSFLFLLWDRKMVGLPLPAGREQ